MAIVMQMKWTEVTPEQYDEACRVVNWEGDVPDGGVLHVAWFDRGLNVWDVWDTAQSFEAFVNDRLMPGVAQIGIAGQPEITILPCHAYQVATAPGVDAVLEDGQMPANEYDAFAREVDWVGTPPVGGIAHIAALRDEKTVHFLSVWDGPPAHQAFATDRVLPAGKALGSPPPEGAEAVPDFRALHRMFDVSGARAASRS